MMSWPEGIIRRKYEEYLMERGSLREVFEWCVVNRRELVVGDGRIIGFRDIPVGVLVVIEEGDLRDSWCVVEGEA